MKEIRGIWLPDSETHLVDHLRSGPEFAGAGSYQLHKLIRALPYVRNFRHAIDVGANVGTWSRVLAAMFRHVSAFEPILTNRMCWHKNVTSLGAVLYQFALGDKAGTVKLDIPAASSGDSRIRADGTYDAEMRTLDSFGFADVDFIKIDVEGFEAFVIAGGEKTIKAHKPCILVEQKPNKGKHYGLGDDDAVRLLESWGARQRFDYGHDYCLSWDE